MRPTDREALLPTHLQATGQTRTVYLREADLVPHPVGWLSGLFDSAN
jgi:hypothetical protein